eukprot:scaffold2042_cov190-Skeletonema_marinoi.AAC.1
MSREEQQLQPASAAELRTQRASWLSNDEGEDDIMATVQQQKMKVMESFPNARSIWDTNTQVRSRVFFSA